MKFELRPRAQVPEKERKTDAYTPVLEAFDRLSPGEALFLKPEGDETVRKLQVTLKRRLGKDLVKSREAEGGLWVWREDRTAEPGTAPAKGPLGTAAPFAANGAAV